MAEPLTDSFAVGPDLVALVGAGGKTTIALALAHELAAASAKVLVTTTTRMGADQHGGLVVVPPTETEVAFALAVDGACLAVGPERDGKVAGVDPEWVEDLWIRGIAETAIVEADGSRRRRVKAPADHEPVVPGRSTLVIGVIGANSIDRIIGDVAHRPSRVAAVAGCRPYDRLTPERAARLMASDRGGRKGVPEDARYVVAITKAKGADLARAQRLAHLLEPIPTVLVPELA